MTVLFAVGCRPDDDDEGAAVAIGSVLSTSGALAGIGSDMLRAAQLAVAHVNEAGGVLGGDLSITNQDDLSDEAGAAAAAQAHVDAGVPAFVGAVGSGYTLAAADVATPAGVVMVSPSSTSPSITEYADDGYLFRTCPSDALQGKLMAQRALAKGLSKAAIIHVPGAYGEGMADSFEAAFVDGGGTVTDKIEYVEGQASYVDMLTDVFANDPDTIALPAYPVDAGIMVSDYNTNFPTQQVTFYFADALQNEDFINGVGAGNFTFDHEGTAPATIGPQFDAFTEAWQAEYGTEPTAFLSNAYDAAMVIALAIEAGGAADGASIRDQMAAISTGGTPQGPNDVAGMLEAIRNGDDIDYQGASGEVDFESTGDTVAPYDIWTVDSSGGIVITEPGVLPI